MLRANWRSLRFWRWWWRHGVRTDVKWILALAILPALLVGGYFAASGLTEASAAGSSSYVLETTIQKIVTVHERGHTVVKRLPVVVRRTIVKSRTQTDTAFQTVVDTKVVTAPGGVRTVERKVVRYVPVVHKRVVHVNGKTKTVTETKLVPTVRTETQTRTQTQTQTNVVTNEQTVTNQSTVVQTRTRTATVVQPVTVTEVHTVTEEHTVTQTDTETQTLTVTTPGDTTTVVVTVTDPGSGGPGGG
jgi:hypothetical protein